MKLFRLFCTLFFILAMATAISMVIPEAPPLLVAAGLTVLFILVPTQKGVLAANGIEAREDFQNVVSIFDRAFNPKFVFDTGGNKWISNPAYNPLWDAVSAFRLTQQTLRMEQPMAAGNNIYTFPILNNIQNQAQQFNTEIRLTQQDTFVPTHLFFGLEYPSGTTDTTFVPKTYPNTQLSTQPVQETAFYNGTLNILVQNVRYTNNWDLWRHYKINETQQTAALGAGSPQDETDLSLDGWYPMQPFVLMIGSQSIEISIKLPVAPTAVTTNGRLVLMMRGVLGQNSTVVN